MVTLVIVFGVLLLLFFYAIIANTSTRLSFLEKESEVIDFIDVYDDFDNPKALSGFKPIVRFEVNEKFYQGTAHVFPLWQSKKKKTLTILYNPENPSEFQVKESSTSPAPGCVFIIIIILVMIIVFYFSFR